MGIPGLSQHARVRMQQRGIPEEEVNELLDFNREEMANRLGLDLEPKGL